MEQTTIQNPAFATRTVQPVDAGVTLSNVWWAVVARFVIHGLVMSTWISRIPAIKASLGLSDGALGLALLGTAAGSLPAIPACGWLVNKVGSKRASTWTATGLCLALLLPGLAVNAVTLFLALMVLGAMAGSNDVAMNAQAVAVEKFLGTPTMSRFHAMFSVGGIAGAAAGAAIASLGLEPWAHFSIAAALILGLSIATAPMMLDARPDRPKTRDRLSLKNAPAALLIISGIGFCIFLSEGAIADWTAVYLKQVLGATAALAAAGYGVFSASMALFRLCGDAITVRFGPASTIRGGAILAACGLTGALLTHSPAWALLGFALVGAGFSSIIPLVFAAGGRVHSVSEGAGVATVSGLGYLGFLVGPPTIGFISELTSLRAGLFVVVVLSAVAALLVSAVDSTGGGLESHNPLTHGEEHAADLPVMPVPQAAAPPLSQ